MVALANDLKGFKLSIAWASTGVEMPFSSLTDPADLARACAALDAAWTEIKSSVRDGYVERERIRLDYIVASLVAVAEDEHDLVRRAVERYREEARA